MDAFVYAVDPYRQASAGYYAPRYPPPYSLYARVPIDPLAGYGVPPIYETDIVVRPPRYGSGRTTPFRSRPGPAARKSNATQQNLGPKKKPFKQTQKVRFTEDKKVSSKKQTGKKGEKTAETNSLLQETKDLHVLFRTGVDKNTGEKLGSEKNNVNGSVKKRKADTQAEKSTPTNKPNSGKKQKGKKKGKISKLHKAAMAAKHYAPLTKEQIEEGEAALDMQRGFCKGVSEFLGLPKSEEAVVSDGAQPQLKSEVDVEPDKDNEETEKDGTDKKLETSQRTPEEEKEVEANSLKFFSGLFADHQELRNMYIDKCNLGSFECLVCHSVDPARSKKFWNVVSLVMHAKMRKKLQPEHSGYGRAVSAVLGWDYENLPKVPRGARQLSQSGNQASLVKDEVEQETAEVVVEKMQIEVELSAEESKEVIAAEDEMDK